MVSFNKGVDLTAGDYLSKIDSEDYVSGDYVESIIKWLDVIKGNDDLYPVEGVRDMDGGIPIKGSGAWPLVDKKQDIWTSTNMSELSIIWMRICQKCREYRYLKIKGSQN